MIRDVTSQDISQVCAIYNYYVVHTTVSFEDQPVSVDEMQRRITATTENYPWIVWDQDGIIGGFAYAIRWKGRAAYLHSAELSVYVEKTFHQRGIGSMLYSDLIDRLRHQGMHALIGGITLPNPASVALHEKLGFEKVAHFVEVGKKFEKWLDVGYWQQILK